MLPINHPPPSFSLVMLYELLNRLERAQLLASMLQFQVTSPHLRLIRHLSL